MFAKLKAKLLKQGISEAKKYVRKLWLEQVFKIMNKPWYTKFMKDYLPKIRFSLYYSLPSNERFHNWGPLLNDLQSKIKAGDIILTIDEKKLTSLIIGKATASFSKDKSEDSFVPGHAALVVATEGDYQVAEMTHLNFTKSTVSDVLYQSTRVVVLRCDAFDENYVQNVLVPTCNTFTDKVYDQRFQQGIQELICSELVYFADKERRLDVNLDPVLGFNPYISPVGLYKAKNCKVIWDSNKI